MKILSRDFTLREKILILLLCLVLLVLLYYQFVDKPVREALAQAEAQTEALEAELQIAQAREQALRRMQNEIDDIVSGGLVREMPSYNNAKAVNAMLNDILGDLGYSITFSNVTRQGDQVRRNISLQFIAPDFHTVRMMLAELSDSPYRCLLDNLNCAVTRDRNNNTSIVTNVTATFFETMVGGAEDAGLSGK